MEQILITNSALKSIWNQSHGCPSEIGGALVGTLQTPLIISAGEPGAGSIKHVACFSTDPDQDRQTIQNTRLQTGKQLVLIGYWHKHPKGLITPSGGDLDQAREILKAWRALGETSLSFVCIISQNNSVPCEEVFAYLLCDEWVDFKPINMTAIKDNDPLIQAILQKESVYLKGDGLSHPWSEQDFRFQNTRGGKLRLNSDHARLVEAGWVVTIRQGKQDHKVSVELLKDTRHIILRMPPEYPLNGPMANRIPEGDEIYPRSRSLEWNSDRCLDSWVEDLVWPTADPPAEKEKVVNQQEHKMQVLLVFLGWMLGLISSAAGYFIGKYTNITK